jgi:DNA-binding MarR family transcriptional regulator
VDRKISLNSIDVEALRRLVSNLDSTGGTDGPPVGVKVIQTTELVRWASLILEMRRRRARHFKQAMFGEPAWDMLLTLYVSSGSTRLTVGRLTSRSGSPPTTGLRWLDYLEREEFVVRRENVRDARTELVEITEKGRSVLEGYLSETLALLR